MPATPVRFPHGVSTQRPNLLLADWPSPCEMDTFDHYNDFSTYAAGDWTVTTTTGSTALQDGLGGQVIQTTAAASGDVQANQLVHKNFAVVPGYRMWFSINFNLSDSNLTTFIAGMVDTLATMAPGNGVYLQKLTGSTTVNLILNQGGTTSTLPIGVVASATAYSMGFYYDGGANPNLYAYSSVPLATPTAFGPDPIFGGVRVNAASSTAASGIPLTNLPLAATLLTAGFGIKAGAAAAKTNTVSYFLASQQVNRF